jgi:hypothetical protein
MTKHFCDRCGHVMIWEARIQWESSHKTPNESRPTDSVLCHASLCDECVVAFKQWLGTNRLFENWWVRRG